MISNKVAVGAAIVAFVVAFAAAPASADTKKKVRVVDANGRVITVVRPSTRITVERRSFLDPGTETKQLNEHYHDYAFSPTYTPYPNQGGIVGFWRAPLPGPFDLPGWSPNGY
jgi:hypothetical protein